MFAIFTAEPLGFAYTRTTGSAQVPLLASATPLLSAAVQGGFASSSLTATSSPRFSLVRAVHAFVGDIYFAAAVAVSSLEAGFFLPEHFGRIQATGDFRFAIMSAIGNVHAPDLHFVVVVESGHETVATVV